MLRLTEAAMLAAPLAAFIAWRLLASYRAPARVMVVAVVAVGLLTASLIWFGLGRALTPGAPYVPARLGPGGAIITPAEPR